MFRPHSDEITTALARHNAEFFHANEIRPGLLANISDSPCGPRNVPAVRNVEILHLVEGINLGEVEGDSGINKREEQGRQ